ncbi:MAG: prenyltransferase/squalene oxidase repeat-containing protein, partial [Planctomycetota bacterium]
MKNHPTATRRLLRLIVLSIVFAPGWAVAAESTPVPRPVSPLEPEAVEESIRRGVEFLLERQNPDGSWGSARNTKGLNIMAPVPGAHQAFRAAVTSLCISALMETGFREQRVQGAVDRGEAWLLEHLPRVRRATPHTIYNTWAHAYSVQALVRLLGQRPEDAERRQAIRELIDLEIDLLKRYECVDGGWCYYDFNARTKQPSGTSVCFVSATVLVALHEANQVGVEMPQKQIDRALASMHRQRKPDFSYCYHEGFKFAPMRGIARPGGSLGRSQACNLAMRLWGDRQVTDEILQVWLDRLFARNGWLDMGRKRPIPHEAWFQVAAYFFY